MKIFFVLSMLISFALIGSCQKQTSTAEQQQLAQRQAELDAREKALSEQSRALEQRERLLARRRMPPVQPQGSIADPNQATEKASGENENAMTPRATVPPEFQSLIADPGRGDEKEQIIQQRLAQRQRKMEELRARRMEHAVVRPGEETPSPTPSATPQ
ncbi:MAG: hypothetical protein DME94_03350 [Verrucomicrobia bacterium]|nr:MAG: hypothetical protein DME94_03350 [Verrucomicrobiota bacterium]